MHVTSSSAGTLSEMFLEQQKSKLKIIFCNIYTHLHHCYKNLLVSMTSSLFA